MGETLTTPPPIKIKGNKTNIDAPPHQNKKKPNKHWPPPHQNKRKPNKHWNLKNYTHNEEVAGFFFIEDVKSTFSFRTIWKYTYIGTCI